MNTDPRGIGVGVLLASGLASVCLSVSAAQAQKEGIAPQHAAFEVASVKPARPGDDYPIVLPAANGMQIKACTLTNLIEWAYGIHRVGDHPIVGLPKWARSARYDIQARVSDADTVALRKLGPDEREDELRVMLRALLADRFRLVLHEAPIDLPIYEMVVARGGPKLKPGTPVNGLPLGLIRERPGKIVAQGIPIGRLADELGPQVERGVVDRTGLTGTYDVTLEWQAREAASAFSASSGESPEEASSASGSSGISIFAALKEQLGLELKSAKGPGEALVIDRVDRPSPN